MSATQHGDKLEALPRGQKGFHVMIANSVAELGGAEQVVIAIAERLPAHGVEVSFALLRPGPLQRTLENRGFRVHTFPGEYRYRNLSSVWRCSLWLTERIREERADLLHSNLTAHFIGGWAARRAGIPEVWHLHDYPGAFDIVHEISRRIPSDLNIFTTEYLKSGEPRLQRTRHRVIHPDSVDVPKLSGLPPDPSVRERLSIGPSPFFLTVTRMQPHKGHGYLIDAAAELSAEYPALKWVIAGRPRGPEQEAYFGQLQAKVASKHLDDKLLFLGFVRDEDLTALYKEALALIHPALSEGYGLVLLEAMACGLPVIAASASGPLEIITHERNGLLVPMRDAPALAAAQRRLWQDHALRHRLKDQALVDVQSHNVEQMVEETLACYRDVLRGRRPAMI